jgi:hypothetical protein
LAHPFETHETGGMMTGLTVLVIGTDARAVGEMVREMGERGARAIACVGDPTTSADAAALHELVAELFPVR